MVSIAEALKVNRTLKWLKIFGDPVTNERVWRAFSGALCNLSSNNSTYLSNHMLEVLSVQGAPPRHVADFLP